MYAVVCNNKVYLKGNKKSNSIESCILYFPVLKIYLLFINLGLNRTERQLHR